MSRYLKTTLVLSMLGAVALAANAGSHEKPSMTPMDRDGNGLVSAAEHAAGSQAMFDRMDANHDGYVTAAEMEAGHGTMMKHAMHKRGEGSHAGHDMSAMSKHHGRMGGMDADGDGVVTAQEHAVAAKAKFEKMDANRDGKVTADEMASGHEKVVIRKMKIRDGKHEGHTMPGVGMHHSMKPAGMIKQMDRNGDGKVSKAEHAAGAQAMFAAADADKDGSLSKAEMSAHHGAMMKHEVHVEIDEDEK